MENMKTLWSKEEHSLYALVQQRKHLRSCAKDHITLSAFVLNDDLSKVLMIYHKKYRSWSWIGGHLEEGETLLAAILRELEEESGITGICPVSTTPLSLEKLSAFDHFHYNATYLFRLSEKTKLKTNEEETEGISWIPIKDLPEFVTEEHMLPLYYRLYDRACTLLKNTSR